MTKQEHEAKEQLLRDTYICDSDYFGRLADLDAEYIESLEAEIAELKAQAIVWHEYPDEIPAEAGVKCLVMFDDGELIVTTHTGLLWYDIEKNWLDRITHWAYLPEPPKEES